MSALGKCEMVESGYLIAHNEYLPAESFVMDGSITCKLSRFPNIVTYRVQLKCKQSNEAVSSTSTTKSAAFINTSNDKAGVSSDYTVNKELAKGDYTAGRELNRTQVLIYRAH